MELHSMTICITGAASGIGHALTLGFLKDGAKVLAVDVNNEGLELLESKGAITKRIENGLPPIRDDINAKRTKKT